MVSGLDRYFQIARCYRDEDTRGDRQPEFTQIDIEASFVEPDDVFDAVESMLGRVFAFCLDQTLDTPFPRITHQEAMDRYGSENPDLRFELPLVDFGRIAGKTDFKVFRSVLDGGGVVKALTVSGDGLSRARIDALEHHAKGAGSQGAGLDACHGGRPGRGHRPLPGLRGSAGDRGAGCLSGRRGAVRR